MKKIFLLLTSLSFFSFYAQNTPLYVGTFTDMESEGIYQLQFNTQTGELTNKTLVVKASSPAFLSYSADRKYIYSVNRAATKTEDDYVSAYKILDNGTLSIINTAKAHGAAACHISIDKKGEKAVVSNYTGGTVSLFDINKDGSLNEASQVFDQNSPSEKSHAHSAQFYKKDLFVADLGRNAVYQYQLKKGEYQLKSPAIIKMEGNPGPRHFSISKNGKYIYIINEYGSSITTVKRTKNEFKQIDYDSTVDENYNGKNSCADIHLSKDERFLYGSNRGENSIAVFKRNTKTGTIDKIQNISVHGDWPRNFTLDPTGKFVLVANRRSNNIAIFSIDSNNGKLTLLKDYAVPTPVCLLF
ncbi:lactonase family protein [Algibacter lectus]|uniref:6-phosphogluconolactonase n=1 Tax=Algibacter lectus TaxID=221126 RepID=A0A4R8M9I8_9FLAO|nr:lactonase family protein [Algibacter lectus]MWW26208.1 beta-propeller fold lactonase family protein [Algibacter lectus]TDY60316.1 6-phosphogluconolactonase [Algibacter lectus]